ncbi:hypothetical protein RJ639_028624 [Escallonia herrerae]|uniref:glutathione transferase n=1 Tax=Escallonia herrerae TaxID=1293975 RepID=A0AA88X3E0_9ASTE|nr:hypothetical protein RJ639_028624 [Escallonia herrerae]
MCRIILKKYPNQGNKVLNGRNPSEIASIDKWVKIEEVTFDPFTTHLIDLQRLLPMRKADGFQRSISIGRKEEKEMLTQAEEELGRLLDNYEKQLKKSPYLAGDVFTLADLYHLPNTQYLMSVPSQAKLFTSRENVRKWWDAISSRASWKKVLEMQQKFLRNE